MSDRTLTPREFKIGLMSMAENRLDRLFVWRLVSAYMGADEAAQRDCSDMLRHDLAKQNEEA